MRKAQSEWLAEKVCVKTQKWGCTNKIIFLPAKDAFFFIKQKLSQKIKFAF